MWSSLATSGKRLDQMLSSTTWTRLYVLETLDGRCSGLCAFELDDETAAFVYAEERVRQAEAR